MKKILPFLDPLFAPKKNNLKLKEVKDNGKDERPFPGEGRHNVWHGIHFRGLHRGAVRNLEASHRGLAPEKLETRETAVTNKKGPGGSF